ncbi:hypothetical protein BROOKERS_43 [Proteus phage vB_PmiP_Brookers]|nr:hypothetical protein BROOKERS_43 [Proteus phage vB_PmiP_Brookers]
MYFQVIYFQKKSQIGMQITSLEGVGYKKALAGEGCDYLLLGLVLR